MKAFLVAASILTMAAVAYLGLSVLLLRPPRAAGSSASMVAAAIVGLSALILAAASRSRPPGALRVSGAGVVLAGIGLSLIRHTLADDHFEGYALVLGAMVVVQGASAALVFLLPPDYRADVGGAALGASVLMSL